MQVSRKNHMDKFKIDSHKLMYHPQRVKDWMEGKTVYPIYMEVSPAGACNHRCTFCGVDFMGYQNRCLETGMFKERLSEMGKLGVKSIMYAGEGEPFLHRDMVELANHTKDSGIDVAFTTNASLFKQEYAENILKKTSWIKVSINAGSKETYAKIHRAKDRDFDRVIENMKCAAKIRRENDYECNLGFQMILLPENSYECVTLVRIARDIGMDYLVVKPYSQHTQGIQRMYQALKYDQYEYLSEELSKFNSDRFHVVFRSNTMEQWDSARREYNRCIALPFWSYIDAGGNVLGCSIYLDDERFIYGNINEQTFQEIWEGEKRKRSLCWVENELDVSACRINCRMDKVNKFLHELKDARSEIAFEPGSGQQEHINFI